MMLTMTKTVNRVIGLVLISGFLSASGTTWAQSLPAEVDVVVVGAGGAGLSAATTLVQGGKRVIVLEKMPAIGGNTIRSGGFFNAVDPKHEPVMGETDSEALYLSQMMKSGGGENTPEVAQALVQHTLPTLRWLESLGLKFRQETVAVWGAEWPRGHKTLESRGQGYIRVLSAEFLKRGGEIFTQRAVVGLMTDATGRVTGVKVMATSDLTAGTRQGDRTETVKAKEAVILASGGFGANRAMIEKYAPAWKGLTTDNNPGNTGDLLPLAQSVGAVLVGLKNVQVVPGSPTGQPFQVRLDLDVSRSLLLDSTGAHLIDEDAPRDQLAQAVVKSQQGKAGRQPVFTLTDQAAVDSFDVVTRRDVYRGLETGAAFRADTLEALAKLTHMTPSVLVATVDAFNRDARGHTGKCARVQCRPIETAPFWASPVVMSIHSTLGGVKISPRAEVLDAQGRPIPGFFAAGEVTGNVHGVNRLGGNGITDAITFGRIAAETILTSR